jgi:hypothetical protein
VRHAADLQECQSKDSVRDARARHHSYHARHLLARTAQHAERGWKSNRGRLNLRRSGVKVVSKVPGEIEPGTFHAALISVFFSIFITSRGGGTRTHTPIQDPDFKSENLSPGTS